METKGWKQFERTGSIADYLRYREQDAVRSCQRDGYENREETGEGYAGFRNGDGNDSTGTAHGRIR